MKKLMLAIAATTAIVSVANADTAWFNGNIGSEATGGSWTSPLPTGATLDTNKYVLDGVESELAFTATTAKTISDSESLKFSTSAKFDTAYDELPEIPSDAKGGVIAFEGSTTTYYVLAKDSVGGTNMWVDTGITATLDSAVAVEIAITNGSDGVHALYKFGDSTVMDKVVASSGTWSTVAYLGSGEVASLVGTTISSSTGYEVPNGDPISADVAEAWATTVGIDKADLAAVLKSDTTYNGRTAAESCLLGVATNAVITTKVVDTDKDTITFVVQCSPVSSRITFTLKKGGTAVGSAQESTSFAVATASSDGTYTLFATADCGTKSEISVSQEIGVKSVAVTADKVSFIAVPYTGCSATDLLKTSVCSSGDKLEVYDTASNAYLTWAHDGSKWVYAGTGDAPTLTLLKGQAIKYTAKATATLYAIGTKTSDNTTAITAGTAKWNLVANPNGAIKASAIPLDGTQAQAVELGDTGVAPAQIFRKVNGTVYYKTSWTGTWTEATDAITVGGGFFLKTVSAESVTWPAE